MEIIRCLSFMISFRLYRGKSRLEISGMSWKSFFGSLEITFPFYGKGTGIKKFPFFERGREMENSDGKGREI